MWAITLRHAQAFACTRMHTRKDTGTCKAHTHGQMHHANTPTHAHLHEPLQEHRRELESLRCSRRHVEHAQHLLAAEAAAVSRRQARAAQASANPYFNAPYHAHPRRAGSAHHEQPTTTRGPYLPQWYTISPEPTEDHLSGAASAPGLANPPSLRSGSARARTWRPSSAPVAATPAQHPPLSASLAPSRFPTHPAPAAAHSSPAPAPHAADSAQGRALPAQPRPASARPLPMAHPPSPQLPPPSSASPSARGISPVPPWQPPPRLQVGAPDVEAPRPALLARAISPIKEEGVCACTRVCVCHAA